MRVSLSLSPPPFLSPSLLSSLNIFMPRIAVEWKGNRSKPYSGFVSYITILLKKSLCWFKEALDYITYKASSVSPEQVEGRQEPVKVTASQGGQTSQLLF